MAQESDPGDQRRSTTESGLDRRQCLKLGASLAALVSIAGCGSRNTDEEPGYGLGEYGVGAYGDSN